MLHDPFNRSQLPPQLADRRERVAMLKRAAEKLVEQGEPEGLFLGGALLSWLEQGGSLERHFLRVVAPRGCHHTPQVIARQLGDDSP